LEKRKPAELTGYNQISRNGAGDIPLFHTRQITRPLQGDSVAFVK